MSVTVEVDTECSLGEGGHRGDAADEGKSTSGPSRSREVTAPARPSSTQMSAFRFWLSASRSPIAHRAGRFGQAARAGRRHRPVPGIKRVSRKENTAAAAVELSGEHIARLNDLTPATGGRHNEANVATIDR
jgi:hypothetical protein